MAKFKVFVVSIVILGIINIIYTYFNRNNVNPIARIQNESYQSNVIFTGPV